MKNSKTIIIALASVLAGLGIGYLFFGRQPATATHTHDETMAAGEETIYTCSMHPQIRQNEPGLCPICEMALIPLEDKLSDDPLVLSMTPEAVKLADIQTTVVGAGSGARQIIRLNGKIKADERRVASQVAHVPGRIEELFVTFTGEPVSQGQKLARIYSPELVTAQRELLEGLKFQDINPALAEAARKKLRYWRIPEATIEAIEKNGEVQEKITVFAEVSGVVRHRRVAVGDHVSEGTVLFEMVDLNRLWALFDAYEEDLANIKVGDRVVFTTPALPGATFDTRITFIDPVIDPNTRVAGLRAEIGNPGGQLKPEMFVRGTVMAGLPGAKGLLVPKTAVLWTGKRSVVYVKVPGSTIPSYQYREVAIGKAVGDHYLVSNGLAAGEEVVTNGAFSIDAAAQLNNQQSMMNRLVSQGQQDQAIDYNAETPTAFKEELGQVLKQYIVLKDALVATDTQAAAAAAGGFLKTLNQIDMLLLQGDAHHFWMQQQNALQAHAGQIANQGEVEEQRRQFEFLSNALIETVQAFGLKGQQVYVQHCPMAFNDRGADWLSYEEEVLNPYFGEKMLKCGIVKDSIGAVAQGNTRQPVPHDH